MKFFLLHVCTLLSVAFAGSHAVTPEVYWKSVLPNSPMPKSIKDLLYKEWNDEKSTTAGTTNVGVGKGGVEVHTGHKGKSVYVGVLSPFIYYDALSMDQLKDNPNVAMFFSENNLHQGIEFNLHFTKTGQKSTFLPRKIADLIPFSSNKLPQIYNKLSVKPDSIEAKIMKQTLNECENKGIEGEEKCCATSLESMVDFSTTKLGTNVKAISTEVNTKESTPLQKYKMEVAKRLAANKAVVCHKQSYPYAVFYCHKTVSTETYAVSMVGVYGTKVKAVAVCHTDTAKWSPKHWAFQVLKVKPGTVPICHILPEDHVVWVPY
ncbi:BURP domain protein RD22-like isoform X1 [Bidens hawaiensis]|uniref:BURP domain protein RD22-like isoform X1 n=1 Tax=Bidens hawaiensis TaxID=980011 RepID=UPI0040492632